MFAKILDAIKRFIQYITLPPLEKSASPVIPSSSGPVPVAVPPKPTVLPIVPKPENPKLDLFCRAIQEFEGYYPGSRSFINRNPGNIRFLNQLTAIGQDNLGFCIFPTYEAGYQALKNLIIAACSGKSRVYFPTMSILAFFNKYAPESDNNPTGAYAAFVAKKIGEPITFLIRDLI